MAKYAVYWGGIDNGGEGKWKPYVWLKTLEILSRHQGERVYHLDAPVYEELERELPDLTWRSSDNGRFRPLFRDYGEAWKSTKLLVTKDGQLDTFQLSQLGQDLILGKVSPIEVLMRTMYFHHEQGEYPFRIIATAFLEGQIPNEFSFNDICFGIMRNYRPNQDGLADALERGRNEINEGISDTSKRRLKLLMLFLERVGAIIEDKKDIWIAWDYKRLKELAFIEAEREYLDYEQIEDDDSIWIQIRDLAQRGNRNFLLVGPPGTSKTWYALHLGAKFVLHERKRFYNIQFHQSFAYEDFMEGYVPSETNVGTFSLSPKVFLRVCQAAAEDRDNVYVLVIDELNRGDPSRIFGEALTYIERRDESFFLASGTKALVPSNLLIISTINPFDKSIADIDMALERRFVKIKMPPNAVLLRKILINNGVAENVIGRIIEFFNILSKTFENRIGHAYLNKVQEIQSLIDAWNYEILPVLEKEFKYRDDEIRAISKQFTTLIEDLEKIANP